MYLHVYIHRENRSVIQSLVLIHLATVNWGILYIGKCGVEKLHHNVYGGSFVATVQYSDTVYSRTGDKTAELA